MAADRSKQKKDLARKQRKEAKKRKAAWGKVGNIYALVNFIHRHGLNKPFKHVPAPFITGISHVFYKAFFGRSKKIQARMGYSVRAVLVKAHGKKFERTLVDMTFKHLAMLVVDLMLKGPTYTRSDLPSIITFDGLDRLDSALAKGKGVLVPSLHVGHFFHCLGGLLLHPREYKVAAVGNMKNRLLFDQLMALPQFKNLTAVAKDKYGTVEDQLLDALNNNHVVYLMHDIAKNSNLRTPFIDGSPYSYLVPTPQGIVALHLKTGAPILPMVSIPDGRFTRSVLRFIDPGRLDAACAQAREIKEKKLNLAHAIISTAINKELFPYAVQYIHTWEEIMTTVSRMEMKIKFEKGSSIESVIDAVRDWLVRYLETSHEPGREDEKLLACMDAGFKKALQIVEEEGISGRSPFEAKAAYIQLGVAPTIEHLKKILGVLSKLSNRLGSSGLQGLFKGLGSQAPGFFSC